MNTELKISILQTSLFWEDIPANLLHLEKQLAKLISVDTDIVILPEMFNTGFTMNAAKVAEPMQGTTMQWMQKWANKLNAALVGSLIINAQNNYYNRLVWMLPESEIKSTNSPPFYTYDKRHLFRMANEQEVFANSTQKLVINYKSWKICPLICYDLRFPVWSRYTQQQTYDCLIYIANWPAVRSYPWSQLLVARAIENLAYVVGVNRVGKDGKGFDYSGDSVALDFRGQAIWKAVAGQEMTHTFTLSKNNLIAFREQFPAWMDADGFELKA